MPDPLERHGKSDDWSPQPGDWAAEARDWAEAALPVAAETWPDE